jgi:hypothetical protein
MPKNAIKKPSKPTEGEKNGGKKPTFFVMSPDGFLFCFELHLKKSKETQNENKIK